LENNAGERKWLFYIGMCNMLLIALRGAYQNLLIKYINKAKKDRDYSLAEELSNYIKLLKENRYLILNS
jgi:hypothetical protein